MSTGEQDMSAGEQDWPRKFPSLTQVRETLGHQHVDRVTDARQLPIGIAEHPEAVVPGWMLRERGLDGAEYHRYRVDNPAEGAPKYLGRRGEPNTPRGTVTCPWTATAGCW